MKGSMPGSCSARILIVDDQAFLMRALCNTLEKEGYQTVGLTSGKAALDALREGSFDLLPSLLKQVLVNLMSNAFQVHAPEGEGN